MDTHTCHPSTMALQWQQAGDMSAREPPPYPGHLKLNWQQSGDSTSYSGSETSTDMSMSSLESLSTSARQEPQGEETADISPGLLDSQLANDISSSASPLLSNLVGDVDLKTSVGGSGTYYDNISSKNSWPVTSIQRCLQSTTSGYSSGYSSPKYLQKATDRRPIAVSTYANNSLIRQLLQNSPQYSHLLSDLPPMNGSPGIATQPSLGTGSPKFSRGVRTDGRSLPTTPVGSAWPSMEQHSGRSENSSSHGHVASRRLVNSYVNIDGEHCVWDRGPSVTSHSSAGRPRDRPRPSTAPTEHSTSQFVSQAVQDPADCHRSYDVLDRVVQPEVLLQMADTPVQYTISGSSSDVEMAKQQQQQTSRRSSPQQEQTLRSSPQQKQRSSPQQRRSPQQQQVRTSPQQQQQQRSSPQQQQCRASPPQQKQQHCSPQQSQQYEQMVVTSSCPLQEQATHTPTDSQPNTSQTICAHAAIATRATQMVERLSEENRALRQELKVYYKKVSKLEKVERDIQKVSDAYETLARHSQKRENLEKLMRLKLEAEVSRLTDTNQQVQEQLEQSLFQLQKRQGYSSPDSELKKEVTRKDALIARFIAQNRELTAAKLKLEADVSAQRALVQETRARVEMLENVLAKEALEKRRLERQHSGSSDHQLHGAGDKCEVSGMKPDEDFQQCKHQQCDTDDGISSDSESPTSIHSLIRQMQDKERHVLRLEAEVTRWEQKFLEETVFRQLAVDAISIPKDAKIAALVQNSADTDKLLAEARMEKLAYLKELHSANERCAHLEAKVKNLQADLAEKDGLVRVLQHHSSLSRASSINSLLAASSASPMHSPQQQHRSPTNTIVHGNSMPASGNSSRQGSQLSAGSASLTKSTKLGTSGLAIMSNGIPQDVQSTHQKMAPPDSLSLNGFIANNEEAGQLKQCFWQV